MARAEQLAAGLCRRSDWRTARRSSAGLQSRLSRLSLAVYWLAGAGPPAADEDPPGQGGAGPPANAPRRAAAGLPALESRESLGLHEREASGGASGSSSSGSGARRSPSRPARLRTTPSRRWVPRAWRACCRHRLRRPLLTIQQRLTGAAASLPCGSFMNRAVLFARSTKAAVVSSCHYAHTLKCMRF